MVHTVEGSTKGTNDLRITEQEAGRFWQTGAASNEQILSDLGVERGARGRTSRANSMLRSINAAKEYAAAQQQRHEARGAAAGELDAESPEHAGESIDSYVRRDALMGQLHASKSAKEMASRLLP